MTSLKEHISYSEVKTWKECGWRHKLIYVDKIQTFEESPHLHFGTIVHSACEEYLKTRKLLLEETENKILEAWNNNGFDSEDFIILQTNRAKLNGWEYKHDKVDKWIEWAKTSIKSLPSFMEENFPNWQIVSAEEPLYENISENSLKFKGFIDCIIKIPKDNNKYKYWILDWKTASARGWSLEKQRDFLVQSQLILYKHFWGSKNNIDMKDISCAFVLLKKTKNQEKVCQLIKVSAGPVLLERSQKLVYSMINTLSKNLYLKNKTNCMFCEYANTDYCK